MKPILKTLIITTQYWACCNKDHRHKTYEVAMKCIESHENKKPIASKKERMARKIYLTTCVINGDTYNDAGIKLGVTAGRAGSIVREVLRQSSMTRLNPDLNKCYYDKIEIIREDRDYWIGQLGKLANHFDIELTP